MKPLLSVRNLSKSFGVKGPLGSERKKLQAVDGISFDLFAGETLGLVGESGCGKSTVARLLLRLMEADGGEVIFEGRDLCRLGSRELLALRPEIQMIFQDPFSSLNPRMTIEDIVTEPLRIHRRLPVSRLRGEAARLLSTVGLSEASLRRYPHEFSGGQRQRVGIARALALKPKLIIADEPVSALDVSIQAQVLNLMKDIQKEFGLTYLFISHDLSVIDHMCDRVAVMYLGRIVESGATAELVTSPRHPYTEALLCAVPVPEPAVARKRLVLKGDPPSAIDRPSGCHFHPRCPYARDICKTRSPELLPVGEGRLASCHFSDQVGKYLSR